MGTCNGKQRHVQKRQPRACLLSSGSTRDDEAETPPPTPTLIAAARRTPPSSRGRAARMRGTRSRSCREPQRAHPAGRPSGRDRSTQLQGRAAQTSKAKPTLKLLRFALREGHRRKVRRVIQHLGHELWQLPTWRFPCVVLLCCGWCQPSNENQFEALILHVQLNDLLGPLLILTNTKPSTQRVLDRSNEHLPALREKSWISKIPSSSSSSLPGKWCISVPPKQCDADPRQLRAADYRPKNYMGNGNNRMHASRDDRPSARGRQTTAVIELRRKKSNRFSWKSSEFTASEI